MKISTMSVFVLLAAMSVSTGLVAQEGPVKYRQAIMKAVSGHAGAIDLVKLLGHIN